MCDRICPRCTTHTKPLYMIIPHASWPTLRSVNCDYFPIFCRSSKFACRSNIKNARQHHIDWFFFYIVVWVDTFHTHEQSTKQRHAFIVIIHNIMTRRRQRSRTRNLSVNTQAWPYAYAQNNAYVDKKIIISLSIPPLGTHTFRCAHLEDVDTSAQFMRFRRLTCISQQIHDCIKFSFGITKSLINMAEICS